jgi:hypothetical protein
MPCESDAAGVKVVPLREQQQPTTYSDTDLDVRQFLKKVSRRVARRGQVRAA